MAAPVTPQKQNLAAAPSTPLSKKNVDYMNKLLRTLSTYLADEQDDDQMIELLRSLQNYINSVAVTRHISLDDLLYESDADSDADPAQDVDNPFGDDVEEVGRLSRKSFMAKLGSLSRPQEEEDDGAPGEVEAPEDEVGSQPSKLKNLTLSMSREVTAKVLMEKRGAFMADMLKLKVVAKVNNVKEVVHFTEDQAIDVSNFFFHELMGHESLNRLKLLLVYLHGEDEDGIDRGAGRRAEVLSKTLEAPYSIRRFFQTFSRNEERKNASSNTAYNRIQTIKDKLELLKDYNTLKDKARRCDPVLLEFMRERGRMTDVGVGMETVILDYVSDTLRINRDSLRQACQSAQGVLNLVEQFGQGVLVILPPSSLTKLNRFGNQRMAKVYPLLKKHVGCFQPVCDLLYDFVYHPMSEGQKPGLTVSGLTGSHSSLQERIMAAAQEEDQVMVDA